MIEIKIKNNLFLINKLKYIKELEKNGFGVYLDKNTYIIDKYEIKYIIEKNKLKIKNTKEINEKLKEIFNKKDNFIRYIVYKDLREKGYIIKDGARFGFDFRVYENKKNHTHTKFVVDVTKTHKINNITKLIKSERLSQTINTEFILAIIDLENKINYLKIKNFK